MGNIRNGFYMYVRHDATPEEIKSACMVLNREIPFNYRFNKNGVPYYQKGKIVIQVPKVIRN